LHTRYNFTDVTFDELIDSKESRKQYQEALKKLSDDVGAMQLGDNTEKGQLEFLKQFISFELEAYMQWHKQARVFTLTREKLQTLAKPKLKALNDEVIAQLKSGDVQDQYFMGPAIEQEYGELLMQSQKDFVQLFKTWYHGVVQKYENELPEEIKPERKAEKE
jgi:hypothetical protein